MAASLSSSEFEGNLALSRDAHLRAQKNCTLDAGAMAAAEPAGHPLGTPRCDMTYMTWHRHWHSILFSSWRSCGPGPFPGDQPNPG
jgi:hypothetical protein